ncbi:MAG: winged helix-turn-helix domain-containing protein [Thiolinea sp.]
MGISQELIKYGTISYNPRQQKLCDKNGEELKLRPQSLKVFLVLAENAGELIRKDDIITQVWDNVCVTDDSLIQCIADIRRTLQDTKHNILKTVPRKGYIFFPPATAKEPTPSAPAGLLPFIGRTKELQELEAMMQKPDCRLLVMLGLGGVGKSCLARALQEQLQTTTLYPDGVQFTSLANLQSPELIPGNIANTLGISLQGLRSPLEILIESLHNKQLLLILDNIEHLLPEVDICLQLLNNCPRLNILITSRFPVQLQGEWIYRLQGFSLPDSPDTFSETAAYKLFLQTAQRINHSFQPTTEDQRYILEICRLVSGMPLGIEIAARWVQHLNCAEIVTEMHQYLLRMRTSHTREQNAPTDLANVLQQSWKMLSEREQGIMQTLAVFRSDFTRTAAAAVAGAELEDFSGLINKSMLTRNTGGRYVLHEVMRRYANEQRIESNSQQLTSQNFFDYHLEFARNADTGILGGQQLQNIVQLEAEHPNLRECLTLCQPSQNNTQFASLTPEMGIRMTGSLGMFWFLANHWQEGRNWATHFLNVGQNIRSSASHAAAHLTAGGLSVLLDDYEIAEKHLETGIAMANHVKSDIQSARGFTVLGVLRRLQGVYPQAIDSARESLKLFDSAGDQGGYQFNLGNMGHSLLLNDLYDEAADTLEQCIRLNQHIGPTMSMPYALVNLGRLHWKLKQTDAARIYLQQTLEVTDKIGVLLYRAQALCILGWIAVCNDELTPAKDYFQQSAKSYIHLGDREGLADALKGIAVLQARQTELTSSLQFITVANILTEHLEIPASADYLDLLLDTTHCIQQGIKPEAQRIYRNLALATTPEELLRTL